MALTGVTRPGHIQLRVLDLEEAASASTATCSGSRDRARCLRAASTFKAWDERDHHSVILRQADRPAWTSSASRCWTRPR
jgi:catechol 2,3-dioxygenase